MATSHSPSSSSSASDSPSPSLLPPRASGSGSSRSGDNSRSAVSEVSSAALSTSSPAVFIALHAGAGYHNPAHHVDLQELFHAACQLALTQAGSAEEAVYLAIQLLESSPLTNAGRGSVLTEDGRVECEASMMLGNGAYSGVGAVCGVEHPIQIAYQLVKERNEYGLIKELGRVRPILLVGEGAWKYAEEKGFARVGPQEWNDHHVTEETRKKWKKFRAIIEKHKKRQASDREDLRRAQQEKVAQQQQQSQQRRIPEPQSNEQPATAAPPTKKRPRPSHDGSSSPRDSHSSSTTDGGTGSDSDGDGDAFRGRQHGTVGAIACDERGRVCAGVSSGGIWMKRAGRIGSAALIGCGCHAENGDDDGTDPRDSKSGVDSISVACSISGCGEDIIEELMAVRCCDALKSAKMSPEPTPHNSIVETDAPVDGNSAKSDGHTAINSSGSEDDTSTDKRTDEKQTEMQRIMKQLIEKEAMRQTAFTSNDKKRKKNSQGSNDTQQQDDGLSSGIIACRVRRRNRARKGEDNEGKGNGKGADGRVSHSRSGDHGGGGDEEMEHDGAAGDTDDLTLDFCYAHTAPHFAIGYAVNDRINGYQNRGWISQQTEEQTKKKIMKLGHLTIKVRPAAARKQQLDEDDDSDGEEVTKQQTGERREQRLQDENEDDKDGHVVQAADGAERGNSKKASKRSEKTGDDDKQAESRKDAGGREDGNGQQQSKSRKLQ